MSKNSSGEAQAGPKRSRLKGKGMAVVIIASRVVLIVLVLLFALLEYQGRIDWVAAPQQETKLWLTVLVGAGLLVHLLVDLLIVWGTWAKKVEGKRVKPPQVELPKYRMESRRLLSHALIVTSGVIIGLAKGRGDGAVRLDTMLLAAGIIFGFIYLSVHGSSVTSEFDTKAAVQTTESAETEVAVKEMTYKWISVLKFSDSASYVLLNLQFLLLMLGIAALS